MKKNCYPVNFVGITTYYSSNHQALDLGWHNKTNEDIFAINDGEVINIYDDAEFGGGNTLVILYDNGYKTEYKHLSKINVKIGDKVKQFEKVAEMGNTGTASHGAHLHINLYLNNKRVNPIEHLYLYSNQEASSSCIDKILKIENLEKKTLEEIAKDVLNGFYGNYPERKKKLEAEGYNYSEVQEYINKLLNYSKNFIYEVKKGDSLWSIALKFYGNGKYYTKIARDNNISNPNKIFVGQKLIIKE